MFYVVQSSPTTPISFTIQEDVLEMLTEVVDRGKAFNPKLNKSKVINQVLRVELPKALKNL